MNQSSQSIYSIVHAKYGDRIRSEDYKAILCCKTVSEVAQYLKSKTAYKKKLDTVKENDFHRGYLEQLIKEKISDDNVAIARFEKVIGEDYYRYVYLNNTIYELLKFTRLYNSGRTKEYVLFMPRNEGYCTYADLNVLLNASTFEDFVAAIKDKGIRDIFSPHLQVQARFVRESGKINLPLVEFSLQDYIIKFVFETSKKLPKSAAKEIRELFGTWCDLENVERIYRMKNFGVEDTAYMRQFLFEEKNKIPEKMLNSMIEAETKEEVMDLFNKTFYKKYKDRFEFVDLNYYFRSVYYSFVRHLFRFSRSPQVSLFAYFRLMQYESENLVRIIESIRYGLDGKEIAERLIGYKEV